MSSNMMRAPATGAPGFSLAPYVAGAGIGVLSWVVFVVVAAPLGITTSLSALSGGAVALITGPEAVAANSYWARHPLRLDYGTLFLLGAFLGALASALWRGTFRWEMVPGIWAGRFGASPARRMAGAFLGGLIAMYGARLANGCTTGNGISQGLQLAVVGWVFFAVMFATGVATAMLLYGRRA